MVLIFIGFIILLFVAFRHYRRSYYLNWGKAKTFSLARACKAAEYEDSKAQYVVGNLFYQKAASGELANNPSLLNKAYEDAEKLLSKSFKNGYGEAAEALFIFYVDETNPLKNARKACIYSLVSGKREVFMKLIAKLDEQEQKDIVQLAGKLSDGKLTKDDQELMLYIAKDMGREKE